MTGNLEALSKAAGPIWLDDLSRERPVSGSLARLAADDHVVGVTTNPSTFAPAIADSDTHGAQIRDLPARGVDTGEAMPALTTWWPDGSMPVTANMVPRRPAAVSCAAGHQLASHAAGDPRPTWNT